MTKDYASIANQLFENSLEPIPIAPGQKYPTLKNWQKMQLPITPWHHNHGVGLRCGRSVWGLDIDITDKGIVDSLLSFIDFPHITRTGKAPKTLIPILCPEIEKKLISDAYVDEHGELHRIEILAKGQQFVTYGLHPDTGKPYEWSGDLLTHTLPKVSKDWLLHFFDLFYDLACKAGWKNISRREEAAEKRVATRVCPDKEDSPSAIYNRAVKITDLLQVYGWTHYKGQYWTRPGKKTGVSASVFNNRVAWIFTSSTILQSDQIYDAFELLSWYEFGGDKHAAAIAVMKEAA